MMDPRSPRDYPLKNSIGIAFDGSRVTASTRETSAAIHLRGYSVSAADVGKNLAIRGGTNFIVGAYQIRSMDSVSNALTLDRPCTIGAGDRMIGEILNQEGRWHQDVPEFFDANLPNNPRQGEARKWVLDALNLIEPGILTTLCEACLKKEILEPELAGDYDWHGPPDDLQWGHVRDAGQIVPSMGVVFTNLTPLKTALVAWAKDEIQSRWNLCDSEGKPLDWVAEAAVQTLVFWYRRERLPKKLKWENLDFYCYRSMNNEDAWKMFDMERAFDAGSGLVRIAPEQGANSARLSDRAQRTAKRKYKLLGQELGLSRMQRVSRRYVEWYTLQTFFGFKLREIRERELRTRRNEGTGMGVGHPDNPDELSAISHGIKKVADLVGFRR